MRPRAFLVLCVTWAVMYASVCSLSTQKKREGKRAQKYKQQPSGSPSSTRETTEAEADPQGNSPHTPSLQENILAVFGIRLPSNKGDNKQLSESRNSLHFTPEVTTSGDRDAVINSPAPKPNSMLDEGSGVDENVESTVRPSFVTEDDLKIQERQDRSYQYLQYLGNLVSAERFIS
ncbi:hypothetical protein EGW08_000380, partial [Elysia chlorotica]